MMNDDKIMDIQYGHTRIHHINLNGIFNLNQITTIKMQNQMELKWNLFHEHGTWKFKLAKKTILNLTKHYTW